MFKSLAFKLECCKNLTSKPLKFEADNTLQIFPVPLFPESSVPIADPPSDSSAVEMAQHQDNVPIPPLLSHALKWLDAPSPYCFLKMKHCKGPVFCSQTKSHTSDPVWNQTFTLCYDSEEDEYVEVFVMDKTSTRIAYEHRLIGYAAIPIQDLTRQLNDGTVSEVHSTVILNKQTNTLLSFSAKKNELPQLFPTNQLINKFATVTTSSSTNSTNKVQQTNTNAINEHESNNIDSTNQGDGTPKRTKHRFKIFALAGIFPPQKGEIPVYHFYRCWSCTSAIFLSSLAFVLFIAHERSYLFVTFLTMFVLLCGHIRQILRFFYGREYLCYEVELQNVNKNELPSTSWCRTYSQAKIVFSKWPHSYIVRALARLQFRTLYTPNFLRKGSLNNGEDFLRMINYGIGRYSSKPVTFTYVIVDGMLRFSVTSSAWMEDRLSKHAVHACVKPTLTYAGILRIIPTASGYVIYVDNDSGTYAPNECNLPQIEKIFKENFPGVKVVAESIFDKHHKKVLEEIKKLETN